MRRFLIEEYRKTQSMIQHNQLKRQKIINISLAIMVLLFITHHLIDVFAEDPAEEMDSNDRRAACWKKFKE